MPYVVTGECLQCGACIVGCESDAISEGETHSVIDVTLCVECGTCMRNCPFDAIIYVEETGVSASPPPVETAANP